MHPLSLIRLVFFTSCLPSIAVTTSSVLRSLDNAPVVHFTLTRRGGKLAPTENGRDSVNLSYLAGQLERTEARFDLTQRQVQGNKLVRKAKDSGKNQGVLMGKVAEDGIWYVEEQSTCLI